VVALAGRLISQAITAGLRHPRWPVLVLVLLVVSLLIR
jgi:hypothetical protein